MYVRAIGPFVIEGGKVPLQIAVGEFCELEADLARLGISQGALVESSLEAAIADHASRTASASVLAAPDLAEARNARRNRFKYTEE